LRRLRQLEEENAALRLVKKRRRPEDAAAQLKELVVDLKHGACACKSPRGVPRRSSA
jgi:hypothetical protein